MRNSTVNRLPSAVMRFPSLIWYPASCKSALALRSSTRSCPDPSETGGTNGFPEYFRRNLRAERLEQGDFVTSGWTNRHHVGIFENGTGSLISAIHDFCVHPFKIERIDEGLTHALIHEFLSSGVEVPALRRGCCVVRDHVALDTSLAN